MSFSKDALEATKNPQATAAPEATSLLGSCSFSSWHHTYQLIHGAEAGAYKKPNPDSK
jgi:hypothetical protein